MNSKIMSARQGNEHARQEMQKKLKVALFQCLDSHLGRSSVPLASVDDSTEHAVLDASHAESDLAHQEPLYSTEKEAARMPVSALVNRLGRQFLDRNSSWQDKIYFYRVVAELMRHALRDFVGFAPRSDLTSHNAQARQYFDFSTWDECVQSLQKQDSVLALILELYYMGGMSYEGIASALSLSIADVDRKLRFARAWVCRGLMSAKG